VVHCTRHCTRHCTSTLYHWTGTYQYTVPTLYYTGTVTVQDTVPEHCTRTLYQHYYFGTAVHCTRHCTSTLYKTLYQNTQIHDLIQQAQVPHSTRVVSWKFHEITLKQLYHIMGSFVAISLDFHTPCAVYRIAGHGLCGMDGWHHVIEPAINRHSLTKIKLLQAIGSFLPPIEHRNCVFFVTLSGKMTPKVHVLIYCSCLNSWGLAGRHTGRQTAWAHRVVTISSCHTEKSPACCHWKCSVNSSAFMPTQCIGLNKHPSWF